MYQSRDLVHWPLAGHVLDRPGQLPLDGVRPSGGLFAATLRQAAGVCYVVGTLVDGTRETGCFVVTAAHPAGPWSDPVWLPEAPGIDPSLFFDDDGRAWLTGTRAVPGGPPHRSEIWLREFDPARLRLTGPEHVLFRGALVDAAYAEGPHLLRHDGHYYLLLAEGGTEYHHAVTVAGSDRVTGSYRNNPGNPVLTHRHLGRAEPVIGPGHADLVQAPDGSWHAVLLAMRTCGGTVSNLGRETFLARVTWEDGWPIINPGAAQAAGGVPGAAAREPIASQPPGRRFRHRGPGAGLEHAPHPADQVRLTARPGHLRLRLRPEVITEACHPSFVGRRLQHLGFTIQTAVDFSPAAASGGLRRPGADPRHRAPDPAGHHGLGAAGRPDGPGGRAAGRGRPGPGPGGARPRRPTWPSRPAAPATRCAGRSTPISGARWPRPTGGC